MTRETKIGLLVGLAFIIVIGILLSDQVTRQNDIPSANLGSVGLNVRQGSALFTSKHPPTQVSVMASNLAPTQQVLTREEIMRQRSQMQISISGNPPSSPPSIGNGGSTPSDPGPTQIAGTDERSQVSTGSNDDPRIRAGQLGGAEVVPLPTTGDLEGTTARRTATKSQEIQAVAGDTLSHFAAKYLGANTKANRDAIVKANPTLAGDPDKIVVGHSYVIPAISAAPTPGPASPAAPSTPAPQPARVADAASAYWYTVQPGDSLIRIATNQLGDPKAYLAIQELNKDLLNGSDLLTPNMKLRLPSKPIATARS